MKVFLQHGGVVLCSMLSSLVTVPRVYALHLRRLSLRYTRQCLEFVNALVDNDANHFVERIEFHI